MSDVFISYSHNDRIKATMVLNILEQNGIRCWIDYRDAVPGIDYAGSIVRAIKSSKFFVLILSAASSASQHVLNEVNSAVNAGATIIPFRLEDVEFNDSFEYYLGKNHWLDAITQPIEEHIYKLVEVIKQYNGVISGSTATKPATVASSSGDSLRDTPAAPYAPKAEPAVSEEKGCRMMTFEQLLERGYTADTIAQRLLENDYINCEGIGDENEGTAEQWAEFLQNNSDTFCYMVNEKCEIVGDWSIVALNRDAMQTALKGELLEKDISLDNTEIICFPGIYNGYILAISLLPEYRSNKNYNKLIRSFFEKLQDFSDDGIFFRNWCINVFGKEVEALVRSLGFKYVCDNAVYGKIYNIDFLPLPKIPLFKQFPRLVANYEDAED